MQATDAERTELKPAGTKLPVRIVICTADVGCGHTRAALALRTALQTAAPQAEVTLIEALDAAPGWFNTVYRDGYLKLIHHAPRIAGWMYDATDGKASTGGGLAPALERRAMRNLVSHPAVRGADVVVCTHFLCARVLAKCRMAGTLTAPLVVAVTDQHPHAVWLNKGADRLLVASPAAQAVAIAAGILPLRVVPTGIPIDSRFAAAPDRQTARRDLGLPGDRPVVLFSGGGLGLGGIEPAVQALMASGRRVHAVAVTARNAELRGRLQRLVRAADPQRTEDGPSCEVLGFTNRMPDYLAAADLLVGKPGGLTTAEAAAAGVPMVLVRPIPGQEERNAALLAAQGGSVLERDPARAGQLAAELVTDAAKLQAMRMCVRGMGRADSAAVAADAVLSMLPPAKEEQARGKGGSGGGAGGGGGGGVLPLEQDPHVKDLPCVCGEG
jgi:processive 1,2-diacylglycerol beta-glucosyltransferase